MASTFMGIFKYRKTCPVYEQWSECGCYWQEKYPKPFADRQKEELSNMSKQKGRESADAGPK
jgi:hypothetical protein